MNNGSPFNEFLATLVAPPAVEASNSPDVDTALADIDDRHDAGEYENPDAGSGVVDAPPDDDGLIYPASYDAPSPESLLEHWANTHYTTVAGVVIGHLRARKTITAMAYRQYLADGYSFTEQGFTPVGGIVHETLTYMPSGTRPPLAMTSRHRYWYDERLGAHRFGAHPNDRRNREVRRNFGMPVVLPELATPNAHGDYGLTRCQEDFHWLCSGLNSWHQLMDVARSSKTVPKIEVHPVYARFTEEQLPSPAEEYKAIAEGEIPPWWKAVCDENTYVCSPWVGEVASIGHDELARHVVVVRLQDGTTRTKTLPSLSQVVVSPGTPVDKSTIIGRHVAGAVAQKLPPLMILDLIGLQCGRAEVDAFITAASSRLDVLEAGYVYRPTYWCPAAAVARSSGLFERFAAHMPWQIVELDTGLGVELNAIREEFPDCVYDFVDPALAARAASGKTTR